MKIEDLAEAIFETARLVGAHTPAFQALAKRGAAMIGGADEARISSVLDEAVQARKKAGVGMQEAGKARVK